MNDTPDSRSRSIDELRTALRGASRPLVITGAGISVDSGIPAYRSGPDSVWATQNEGWATRNRFQDDPADWWETFWKRQIAPMGNATPNEAHERINELIALYPAIRVITQNIDGLHTRAGLSAAVHIEVHGNAERLRCDDDNCAGRRSWRVAIVRQLASKEPPRCPSCFCVARPSVLLFDEIYASHSDYQWLTAASWIGEADVLLLVGTSNAVTITEHAILSALGRGKPAWSINPTSVSSRIRWIASNAERALAELIGPSEG